MASIDDLTKWSERFAAAERLAFPPKSTERSGGTLTRPTTQP